MKRWLIVLGFILNGMLAFAQQPTQTIKGVVIDQDSQSPILYANIVLLGTNPIIGAISDDEGHYIIENVPLGRYDLQASFVGYESVIIKELIVSSSKGADIDIKMKENAVALGEVIIKPMINKERALNSMATVSARMLSVEEAKRYAGGFDDPARLVSSFAGVANNNSSNGIVVRGNAPKSLQWKLEGVEIPNPNHFADLQGIGGGAITGLSSQLLANSDFFSGAMPAEYSNALSGVFDIFMRKGNNDDYEHTFQLGAMGIDLSTEGPFKKEGNSSYLINYRYSTFGLVSQITNAAEGIEYQDLSFKLNFPTKKAGVFSVWGLGLIDNIKIIEKNTSEWKYQKDKENYDADQYMGATGINHKLLINNKTQLNTTLAATVNGLDWKIKRLNSQVELMPQSQVERVNSNFILSSSLNTKISTKHTNKTGVLFTGLKYNMLLKDAIQESDPLTTFVDETGFSQLFTAYTSSTIRPNNRLTINAGLNYQFFALNNNFSIEPRLGVKWQWKENQQLSLGYGLHGRLEQLNYFFTKEATSGAYNNKEMDFTKTHHFVLNYSINLSENLFLKIEPYYQYLFDVPVVANSSYSFINLQDDWFINDKFENSGNGRNYGIDITLEKYLTKGYYFMFTGTLFNSEYRGGDNVWRNTRYNRNYVFNALGGREWNMGQDNQNVLGLNIRLTYQGGDRYTSFKTEESILVEDVVFDETKAFEKQIDPAFILNFTASYKINKKKVSHEFALKVLNATSYGDLRGFQYNYIDKTIDEDREAIMIPNLSYKIEF